MSDAQDCYGCSPAVTIDGDAVDFERFAECVEFLADDLMACGVVRGRRVGLGIASGWVFVLTWHALVAVDAVVVPVDLCDSSSIERARELDLDFLLAHEEYNDVLEDAIDGLIDDESSIPVFRVADEFALVDVSSPETSRNPLSAGGGGLVSDLDTGRVEATDDLLAEADRLGRRLDLWPGVSVQLGGVLNTRRTMLLIIACAARGACACVDATPPIDPGARRLEMVPVIDRPEWQFDGPLLSVG
ncbi:hypothetical protein [Gordonia sp. OPL2]|uniref:hypothetical protein n=1 Tax=Gordonia sp. OPL2 TaxID=2486274 RepID=UPI001655CA12|nr:hypothetical protein [Gordonia sp. OPL2]RPA12090.1 hypothetical protein EEB19_07070 [Gordonia sp. OPL2]